MQRVDFHTLFDVFRGLKAMVLGDVMLDAYLWGRVERISPEAPVPVVQLTRKDHRIGGAGNVALNLVALGATTTICTVTGDDEDGALLRSMLKDGGIDPDGIIVAKDRVTTTKTRIISRNQQMLRIDHEITEPLDAATERRLIDTVIGRIDLIKPQVLVLEDYDKGVLTGAVIQAVTEHCKARGIITAVDPKRRNFFAYAGVDIFKPNLKEVREGLQLAIDPVDMHALAAADRLLRARLGHHYSFITLSEQGVFHSDGTDPRIITSHMRNIADVSGAGDTVVAVASLAYAATRDMGLAAAMANIAGGLVCEEVGTVAIDRERLLEECCLLLNEFISSGRKPSPEAS